MNRILNFIGQAAGLLVLAAVFGLTVSGLPGSTNYFVVRAFTPAHTGEFAPCIANAGGTAASPYFLEASGCADGQIRIAPNNRNDLTSVNSAEVSAGVAPPFVVTKTADTNGTCNSGVNCSLREAIAAANATNANDSITFAIPPTDADCAGGVCTVRLGGTQLTINSAATAGTLSIINPSGAANLLVSGNNLSRVFLVNSGGNLTMNGLTVTGGRINSEFGIPTFGGGILNDGTLTLTGCAVRGNSLVGNDNVTPNYGGGIANRGTLTMSKSIVSGNSLSGINYINQGGGIYSEGFLTLTDSTVSDNRLSPSELTGYGGGIMNIGTMSVANSTVSGNSISGGGTGGGIYNYSNATISLTNCTISGNSADDGGGILNSPSMATVNARNTIISGNSSPSNPNLRGLLTAASENNIVGNESSVRLAPLGFYGGATMTHSLLNGSSAINTGNNCVTTQTCANFNAPVALTADQRGAARVGNTDIGAFELSNSANGGNYVAELPTGQVGMLYNYTLVSNNGAFTYSQTGGTLPNGISLNTMLAPNAVVSLGGTSTIGGNFNFTVTATDGTNTNLTDYRLQIFAPTAAGVSVSGRVLTANGRGLANAVVTLTDQSGATRSCRTGSFGYYYFEDVAAGASYIFNVTSKRYQFAPHVINVNEEIRELNFTALQ